MIRARTPAIVGSVLLVACTANAPLPDAGIAFDAGVTDAASDLAPRYHAITAPASWSVFDTKTVNPGAAGFYGAVFDGRYVYFVPYSNANGSFDGIVTRYDTQSSFTDAASWSTFDTTTVNVGAQGFLGATFDGRYIYFMPHATGSPGVACTGVVARYDTQASFTDKASWSAFDTHATVPDGGVVTCFSSATFDGQYVYLVPFGDASFFLSGLALRYDSRSAFASAASWTTFDIARAVGGLGFAGAVFDGRYIYYIPNGGQAKLGQAARYDTHGTFGDAASWSTFDTTMLNPSARSFVGGAFDGRYVYFVPDGYDMPEGLIVRYDTTATFTDPAAWSTLDLVQQVNSLSKGFYGAAFDGRYLYLVPNGFVPALGVVTRYDTQTNFASPSSWSTFDVTRLNAAAKGFVGSVFDGRYVYLVPYGDLANATRSGLVVRFDAKTPASMPGLPAFHGSFF